MKDNLAKASFFVLAYEILQDSIIERPKGFFTVGGLMTQDMEHYKTEVLDLVPKSRLFASCQWFRKMGVLTEQDIVEIGSLRDRRNEIAHQLANILLSPDAQVDEAKLVTLYQFLSKIDSWWITEIEIPTNPDYDGLEIAPDEVRSGGMEFLAYLIRVLYEPAAS